MSEGITLLDVIEDVLGVPCEPEYVRRISLSEAHTLAVRLENFYKNFEIPEKADGELRPYLSTRFTTTHSLSLDYYSHPEMFRDGKFEFDRSKVKDLAPQVKTYLLYCHGVCIHDPLPALLDYFGSAQPTDFALRRLPAVAYLLEQYAELAPLIRNRILVPISDPTLGGLDYKRPFLIDDSEEREIVAAFVRDRVDVTDDSATDIAQVMGDVVKQHWWARENAKGRFDFYFPDRSYVSVLQGLLHAMQARFASKDVLEPFNASILATIPSVNAERVSLRDIISVRQEGAFEDFRRIVRAAFDRLEKSEGRFSDIETEFKHSLNEELDVNKEKVKALSQQSSVLSDALWQSDRILVGSITGAFASLLAGSTALAAFSAAAGGARVSYDIVRNVLARPHTAKGRTAMRNHFLALEGQAD